ncbi:PREDICTED: uncharacterized protein LOC104599838 [Nelumbo nucifera]|uniref:Uncharacterized protein LOC104599838 n=2 Tax=Nelumbo nucifera TaxID=4432 RepID=A0A1U8A3H6_NELNU|nr:PREDICTED: uncharacterized protein LOC104599838 [Nelumbo nucifera]XP_010260888.1 PREDICTED: uncharacterized protein LOC104599838 [Nelumbo nucifera]XP_010260893.1 PREDICTED: uncharacterized protein LOC104599838 [Nelumbo nucifera]DAD35107.1 TPA_asm: hypothetical protein HUJ06_005747 [Nelumbo nucifera]
MEGSFGNIREQWEQASLKRKTIEGFWGAQSGLIDQDVAFKSHADTQKNVGVENRADHLENSPVHSTSSTDDVEKENFSFSSANNVNGDTSLKSERETLIADLDRVVEQETEFAEKKYGSQDSEEPLEKDSSSCDGCHQCDACAYYDGSNLQGKDKNVSGGHSSCKEQAERSNYVRVCPEHGEANNVQVPCGFNAQSVYQANFSGSNVTFKDKEAYFRNIQQLEQVNNDSIVWEERDEGIYEGPPLCNTHSSNEAKKCSAYFGDMVEPVSEVPSFHNVQPCYETEVNCDVASSGEEDGSAPWIFSCNIQMRDDLEVNHDGARYLNKDKLFIKDSSICNTQQNKTQDKHMEDCFKDERKLVCESLSNSQPQDEKNPSLHAQDENDTLNVQNNLVREKLKETDEYKHAAEEEWAARQ